MGVQTPFACTYQKPPCVSAVAGFDCRCAEMGFYSAVAPNPVGCFAQGSSLMREIYLHPRVRVEGTRAVHNCRCAETSLFGWRGILHGLSRKHRSGTQVRSWKKSLSSQAHEYVPSPRVQSPCYFKHCLGAASGGTWPVFTEPLRFLDLHR